MIRRVAVGCRVLSLRATCRNGRRISPRARKLSPKTANCRSSKVAEIFPETAKLLDYSLDTTVILTLL
jgi:hypothetical protein